MNITYQPLTQAHKTDVFLLANDQAISRTSGVPLPPFSIQVIENWIVQTQPAIEQHHVILVDNNIVGMLILKKIESHHAELAFWIGQQFWGYGYAYAAARALIDQ